MDVKQKLDSAELLKLVEWVTHSGDYTFGPDIVDGSGRSIGALPEFDAYAEVSEGAWPQSDQEDGIDYIGMVAIQENGDKVYEAVEEHGADVVRLTAKHMADSSTGPVHINDLTEFIQNNFKGTFDSPGEFAKWYARVDGGPGFDERTLDEFSDYIDWESYGTSPNMGDYDLIKPEGLDEDAKGPVYAFDADPEFPED